MRKLSTHDFINKAVAIHGDKYDYSETIYLTSRNKIKVTCITHGVFEITGNAHLRGVGCSLCSKETIHSKISNVKLRKKFVGILQPKDYKIIPLTKGKYAIVDNDDFDRVKNINWCYTNRYAFNLQIGLLHRFIMNTNKGEYTDHIDGDGLNNRRINLRTCTQSENMANVKPMKGCTSVYKGVYYNKKESKWYSQIKNKNKSIFIGSFCCEIEAARAYNAKALELFGEFACINIF